MKWLRAQSVALQLLLIVMLAIGVGCVALPMGLHHMALARIREANLDAIRFAAVTPEQLHLLPVTGWREGEKVNVPTVQKIGWEQYQMTLPHGEAATTIDVDLRSTMLPLMLGFGGWMRIAVMIALSGAIAYLLLKWSGLGERVLPPDHPIYRHRSRSLTEIYEPRDSAAGENGGPVRRHPFPESTPLINIIMHVPHPVFHFNTHHQLAHWNDAAQAAMPNVTLSAGIHMLDLSAHLPWGNEMIEKMDEVAQQSALIIHKGDSLCVIPG